ncbi:MAG TPA: hypothetical protein VGH98_16715 [Gemmatimonadaceae bacterium]|jgi:hypothetical protein
MGETLKPSYRSTFESLADDADFQELTPLAQAVFWSLKLKLGQYGIAVFYKEALPAMHRRATDQQIQQALRELEAPKLGRSHGWIRTERNVVWIVNGLKFEPSFTITNPNHRTGVVRFVRNLPRLPIVEAFITHYELDATPAGESPSPSPPPTHPLSYSPSHGESQEKTKTETSPDNTSPSSSPARVTPLHGRLASENDRAALDLLLSAVSNPNTWVADLAASLDGMPGHRHVTPIELGIALRAYAKNGALKNPNSAQFDGYLRRAKSSEPDRAKTQNGAVPRSTAAVPSAYGKLLGG